MSPTTRATRLYLAAAGLLVASSFVLPQPWGRHVVPPTMAVVAAVAILLSVRRNRPEAPTRWQLFAAGAVAFGLAQVVFHIAAETPTTGTTRPPGAGLVSLAAFVLTVGGVLVALRERSIANRRAYLLDGLLGATAMALLGWTFLVQPMLESTDAPGPLAISAIFYPLGSLVLLGASGQLWKTKYGGPNTSNRIVVLAMMVLVATNFAYGSLVLSSYGEDLSGAWASVALGWTTFFTLIGLAGIHPSMATPPATHTADYEFAPWSRFVTTVAVAAGAPIVVVAGESMAGRTPDLVPIIVGTAVMVVIVLIRMSDIQADLRGALSREHLLRIANDKLVAATDLPVVRSVLVETTEQLMGTDLSHVWLVEQPRVAGFSPPEGSNGPVHVLRGEQDLRLSLDLAGVDIIVVAELPTRSGLELALVAGTNQMPSREVVSALDALVQCAALAVDRVNLSDLVLTTQSEERLQRLLQDASDVVAVLDRRFVVSYVTPAVERVLGRTAADVAGTNWLDHVRQEDRTAVEAMIVRSNEGWPARGEFQLVAKDGGTRYVDVAVSRVADVDGGGFTIACHDVTQRHTLEQQLSHQAFHDALTGLANRALFQNRLRHTVERSKRTGEHFAVLFVDLDDFKTVNDSLGHAAGDTLLRTVGTRLSASLRGQDTAARLGGDEFAVILEDTHDVSEVDEIACRILEGLTAPVQLGGSDVPIGASIGIAHGGAADDDPDELMRNADLALYEAKSSGKGQHATFAQAMHDTVLDRMQLKAELRRGLNQDEFLVQFQPLFTLDDAADVVGVEALVRWAHPTRGLLAPLQFVGLAEETGLIVTLGRRVLEQALAAAADWHRIPGHERLIIAINLSGRQLLDDRIVDDVREAIERTGIDPSTVVLEITESVLLPDGGVTADRLVQLVALGVRLYIDDFGTGYSSLAYLRDLPVAGIKLAREFVDVLPGTPAESGLVRTIHDLAGTLGLDYVVAEGIETSEQRDALIELGYTVGQGFFLARPTDEAGIETLLAVTSSAGDVPVAAPVEAQDAPLAAL